jgi:hypothetical protein
MDTPPKEPRPLIEKVKSWLDKQGYPLEFRTASAFSAAGIPAEQGFYVRETNASAAREVDVVAGIRRNLGGVSCHIDILVECKWSGDKPWVVFTNPRTIMAPSACIAQTIGSSLGQAVMYCLAGNVQIQAFDTFASRERNGFGGRRAFSGENELDLFHSTVQGIVSKTLMYVKRHDEKGKPDQMPTVCRIAFPMIVIDGELFEAYFDPGENDLRLKSAESIRLHWRGAESPGSWISTLDIVKLGALEDLISRRKLEWERLRDEAELVLSKIAQCYGERSLTPLEISPAPRGYVGLPKLLFDLRTLIERHAESDRSKA